MLLLFLFTLDKGYSFTTKYFFKGIAKITRCISVLKLLRRPVVDLCTRPKVGSKTEKQQQGNHNKGWFDEMNPLSSSVDEPQSSVSVSLYSIQAFFTVSRRFRPDERASMNLSEVSQFKSDEMTLNSSVLICKSQWRDLYTACVMFPACSSVTEHLVLSDFHQLSKHAGPTVCPLVTFAV